MDIRYPANTAECFGTCYIDHKGVLRHRKANGDYVRLPAVDFGKGRRGFEVTSFRGPTGTSLVEVHLDSLDGKCIGVCNCSYFDFENLHHSRCEIEETSGIHDVYLVFTMENGYRSFCFTQKSPYDSVDYIPVPDSAIIDVQADTWEATDMLGRRIAPPEECPERRDREVGMFYWIWHENNSKYDGFDIQKELAKYPEAEFDEHHPIWSTFHAHWSEPGFGFYRNSDPYVIRKHMIMLANAGVDYLTFDFTNGAYMHKEGLLSVLEGMRLAKLDGIKVPKFMFMMSFFPCIHTYFMLRTVYQELYKPGFYSDLWYEVDGKPVVMAFPESFDREYGEIKPSYGAMDDKMIAEIKEFFTFRPAMSRYDIGATRPDNWGWLQEYPQHRFGEKPDGTCEQMTVGGSLNKTDDPPYNRYNIPGSYGRSYTAKYGFSKLGPDSYKEGHGFKEQFEFALKNDPERIFVSGWNEWTVGRFKHQEYIYPYEGGSKQLAIVDEFDLERSREIEPDARGGYQDTYYLLLCNYIRQYKGTAKPEPASAEIKGEINWADVTPVYRNHKGSAPKRDYPGFGKLRYSNRTGRNDIIEARTARDCENLYFYAKCVDTVADAEKDNCMNLLINTDRNYFTGWEGYNFLVSGSTLYRHVKGYRNGGYNWEACGDVTREIKDNTVVYTIKKSDLGIENIDIEFKWFDNCFPVGTEKAPSVMDFYYNGVAAPFGRFNYRYKV